MIYITGDTHANAHNDLQKLSITHMKKNDIPIPDENDKIIICGDFGFPFYSAEDRIKYNLEDEYRFWMNWFSEYHCEIYFVDGNHDNHPYWNSQPVITRHGGKMHAHPDAKNVFHMIRGEVYVIDGLRFFAFGGAVSHDKVWRKIGVDWWPEEEATEDDFQNALKNLARYNYEVDYVISHTLPMTAIDGHLYERVPDRTSDYLSVFYNNNCGKDELGGVNFKQWFCGHYHKDGYIAPGIIACYNKFILINDNDVKKS